MLPAAPPLPHIVAHRGNAAEYPENTLPALRAALELGIRFVEFDVQLSADHVPILLHDADLRRTAGIDRNALDMTWRELKDIQADEPGRLSDRYPDATIPSLEQMVSLLKTFPDAMAFVELKRASLRTFGHERMVSQVCELLQPIADRCAVISFDLAAVNLVRQTTTLPIGWVLSDITSLTRLKCEAVAPEYLFCDHEQLPKDRERLWRGPWRWAIYEVSTRELALDLAVRGAQFVETMAVRSLLQSFQDLQSS